MLDPNYLLEIAEASEQIAEDLHAYMIKQIVRRIIARFMKNGELAITGTDRFQINLMQEAGALLNDVQAEIALFTGLEEQEIASAMIDAGIEEITTEDAVYKAVGLENTPLSQSPVLQRIMQRNYEATLGSMQNFTKTTADACQQTFIKECDTAYNKVIQGAEPLNKAVEDAIKNVARDGVRVTYTDPDTGKIHTDTVETATTRAVRTGVSQATGDITMQRLVENDWDIILVSAHLGARYGDGGENAGNHEWWQGKFYSRSGNDPRFLPFSVTGYGTGEGLRGWNCRHSFGAGDGTNNPYTRYDSKENRKAYDLSQQQRKMERAIRKTKQIVVAYQTSVDNSTGEFKDTMQKRLERASAKLMSQQDAYTAFCAKNKLRKLDDRIQMAQYGREQRKRAMMDAKNYKKGQIT